MKNIIRLLIVFGWLSATSFTPLVAEATTMPLPDVYISEIAWAGSSLSNADEWIELVNLSEAAIDVSGWALTGAASGGEALILPEDAIIEANSTYLIANYDQDHENSVLDVYPDLITTTLSLSNSALGINLTTFSGTVVDAAGAGSSPPAGSSSTGETGIYTSMKRLTNADGTGETVWMSAIEAIGFDAEATELGTPGTLETIELINEDRTYDPDQENPPTEDTESESTNDDEDAGSNSTDSTETESTDSTTSSLIINEFVSDPVSGHDEWVEIYNPSDDTFIIAEWMIREGSGATTILPDTYLSSGQYVVVGPISGKLNNGGDVIELVDPDGMVVDSVSYGEGTNVPAVSDPDAVALDASGLWQATTVPTPGEANVISDEVFEVEEEVIEEEVVEETVDEVESTAVEEETPAVGEAPTTTVTSYDLRLSEIYPNTSGEDSAEEFIELVNTGSVAADLMNWSVMDASGKTFTASESHEVQPGALVTLQRATTKIALNNSGSESVSLVAPNGATVDELSYDKTTKGYSLILQGGTWTWTSTPTPNEPNVLSEAPPVAEVESSPSVVEETVTEAPTVVVATPPTTTTVAPKPPSTSSKGASVKKTASVTKTSISKVRDLALNTKVQVSGTVAAPPGLFARQVMYLAGSGIQVYMYSADWPELETGDVVELSGELTSSRGETRIKISTASDINVVNHGADPSPHEIEIEEVGEEVEGWLVSVSGVIQTIESDRLTLEADESTVLVIAKEATGMDLYELNEGMRIQVTGVVSQYYDSYRILPRSMNDVEILESELAGLAGTSTKDQATSTRSLIAIALTVLSVAALSFFAFRYLRNKKLPEFTAKTVDYSAA